MNFFKKLFLFLLISLNFSLNIYSLTDEELAESFSYVTEPKDLYNLYNSSKRFGRILANQTRINVDFSKYPNLTDDNLINFIDRFPNIVSIKFGKNFKITDKSVMYIANICKNLEIFDCAIKEGLSWYETVQLDLAIKLFSSDAINYLIRTVTCLKKLDVSLCTSLKNSNDLKFFNLTTVGFSFVDCSFIKISLRNCPDLKTLRIYYSRLDDDFIVDLANNCKKLESVSFINCFVFSDLGMAALCEKCPNLKKVNVLGSDNLTENFLINLCENCQKLTEVNVERCPKIKRETIKKLRKLYPNVKIVDNYMPVILKVLLNKH